MVLIDTSCWTHALRRKGNPQIRERVASLLATEQAAWCDVVRLELWNGAASDWDKKLLDDLDAHVKRLPIIDDTWQRSIFIAVQARQRGVSVPLTDILIWACAELNNMKVESADGHFDLLEQLAVV